MKELEEARREYENIPISDRLSETVNEAIRKGEMNMQGNGTKKRNIWKVPVGIVAAAACVLVIGLNTSEAFGNTMSEIPVIGKICKILTIRNYETETKDENINTTINKPEFSVDNTQGADEERVLTAEEIAARVNKEIDAKITAYTEDATRRMKEYKEAFLATGGTEEEWLARDIDIMVDYEIKSQTEDVLSFAMNYFEGWASAYGQTDFYNISMTDGHDITLAELLGENYAAIIEESVRTQAAEQVKADESLVYWLGTENEYLIGEENVFESPKFYINEEGNVVVVFEKYTIAPGYMGAREFVITK